MMDDTDVPEPLDPNGALDHEDETALAELGALLAELDGMPPGFVDRMRFAVAARGLNDELAQLTRPVAAAARGSERQIRTWTFEAPSLTILVTAESSAHGGLRLDGWLAPATATARTVYLRLADGDQQETAADEQGRFTYAHVPSGLAQIVVSGADLPRVVTLTFDL